MRGLLPQGDVVRRLRQERGLTQEALALNARCDVKTIRNAERGNRVDASTVQSIANALSEPLSAIIVAEEQSSQETAQQNIKLFWDWQIASNARDVDGMVACYHPDATVNIAGAEGLPGGGEFCGLDAIREQWAAAQMAFETEELTPDQVQVHATADLVFARAEATARVRATGLTFTSMGVHEFVVKEGKFFRHTLVVDTAAVRRSMRLEK